MKRYILLLVACLGCSSAVLHAQSPTSPQTSFPTGLSVKIGTGLYAMRDEYISKERYSGMLPYLSANWSRFHDKWGHRVKLDFRNSSEIKNHNVSTDILHAAFQHDYLYPLRGVELFGKDILVVAGPSYGLYFFLNQQNIAAQGALHADMSMAMQLSLGLNASAIVPVGSKLLVEGTGWANMVAIGVRNTDPVEEEGVAGGVLSALSGAMITADLGLRYRILDRLSIKAAGMVQIMSINKWMPLLTVSDNLTLTISYHI